MGISNRDYYRESCSSAATTWGLDGLTPVVKFLLIANIAVFLLQIFMVREIRQSPLEMLRKQNPDLDRALSQSGDLFAGVPEADLPAGLGETLGRNLPLALNLNTEKARSELLIAPVLGELKLRYPDRLSVFSGIEFTVDAAAGLSGRCDYILARSPQ